VSKPKTIDLQNLPDDFRVIHGHFKANTFAVIGTVDSMANFLRRLDISTSQNFERLNVTSYQKLSNSGIIMERFKQKHAQNYELYNYAQSMNRE